MDRPLAVLSDFDGTITVEDVAEVLLARFATGEWEEIERLNRAGVLGTRETMARQFAIVHATREELSDCFRREARMDPAVPAFLRFCKARGIPFEVVSEGLDFYLDELMKVFDEVDTKAMGGQYYVYIELVQPLLADEKTREQGLKLFKKAWQAFPDYRASMMGNFYDDALWQLPELYEAQVLASGEGRK